METLFIFLVKSSGLIGMFYLSYVILLRKETFFNSNRWFLLAGLISSVILPLVVFKKIVWVDPLPTAFDWSKIPVTTPVENDVFEINWYVAFGIAYSIGIVIFLIKFAFDLYNVSRVLRGKTIQKQADFKFIDVKENVSPFSYFNFIVYNSSLYSITELENILEHEKVHSAQNHTVDVLISRLFCVVFWFNPLVWLYKKAISQNLEFIADSEASKNISDKKAYQLTLLKITTQEKCVAITNHFYQSLIKKRIVMLNKNESNKRNYWKYALVLPLSGAFVFFFQVKVIAQEKESPKQEISNKETPVFIAIEKNTSDTKFNELSNLLEPKYNVTLLFSKIKRNKKEEITAIKVEYKHKDGRSGATEIDGTNPISSFYFFINGDKMGFEEFKSSKNNKNVTVSKYPITTDISLLSPNDAESIKITNREIFINGEKVGQKDLDKLNPNEIENVTVDKKSDKGAIRIVTKKFSKTPNDNDIYITGEKADKNELLLLEQNSIDKMDVNKNEKTDLFTITTINQSADNFDIKKISKLKPIIILDGKKTEANFDISNIDENQIETMKVFKGQNAIEKYGKDGENGVIEIITKKSSDILKSTNKQ